MDAAKTVINEDAFTPAKEYDAAQERGELAKNGQRGAKKAVLKENGFSRATSSEIGTLRREIHEARQLRDAEAADPGVVERALESIPPA